VSFVNSHEGKVESRQAGPEQLCLKSFGADVQQPVVAVQAVIKGYLHFFAGHAAMNSHCLDIHCLQSCYLVFHQCYQGCDDQAKALTGNGGQLVG